MAEKKTEYNFIPSGWMFTQTVCLLVDYVFKPLPFWIKYFPSIILPILIIIGLLIVLFVAVVSAILEK